MFARPIPLCLLVTLTLLADARATDPASQGKPPATDNVLAEYDIGKNGEPIILPVRLGDKTYPFLLDTGCTRNWYDVCLKRFLGPTVGQSGVLTAHGQGMAEKIRPPEAYLGKMSLAGGPVAGVTDFTAQRRILGQEFYGVIGLDFVRQHTIRLDFDRGRLTVLRVPGSDAGRPVAVRLDDFPWLAAGVRGSSRPLEFVVDTGLIGTDSGMLAEDVFARLVSSGGARRTGSALGFGLSGTQRMSTGDLAELRLGGFTRTPLAVESGSTSALGLGYWRRYVVTLDFPHEKLYLSRGKHFDAPELRDQSGLHALRLDGQTVIASVDPTGPADRAGLLAKDVVLQVDGRDVARLTMLQFRRLLCQPGKKVALTIRRSGREIHIQLPLDREDTSQNQGAPPAR